MTQMSCTFTLICPGLKERERRGGKQGYLPVSLYLPIPGDVQGEEESNAEPVMGMKHGCLTLDLWRHNLGLTEQ